MPLCSKVGVICFFESIRALGGKPFDALGPRIRAILSHVSGLTFLPVRVRTVTGPLTEGTGVPAARAASHIGPANLLTVGVDLDVVAAEPAVNLHTFFAQFAPNGCDVSAMSEKQLA